MDFRIQSAGPQHFSQLRNVELQAFRTLLAAGAVQGVPVASSDEDLMHFFDQRLLFAAFDLTGRPVGYVGGYETEDGSVHVAEMDVDPDMQRRGIGRCLMETMIEQARLRGVARVTLTTDRLADFNAPFYAKLGFQIVEETEMPARLTQVLREEVAKGLDPARRCAMEMVLS